LEENLIRRAVRRDQSAIETLYDTYAPKLLAVAMRYCGNREDAEDILHDAFIKIIKNIHTYKETGSFEAWMKRIVVNTALNHLRNSMKSQQNLQIDPIIDHLNIPEEEDPDFMAPLLQLGQNAIMQLICDLPIGYRTVFNLYVFEGYGHKEIASQLGFNENTSKSQLSKARAWLRKKIDTLIHAETLISNEKH
jgi:RNA polymerase sigma-70 factor (ECF subfamily)